MFKLALKMTARDWRAGQLRFLLIALTVAAVSYTHLTLPTSDLV